MSRSVQVPRAELIRALKPLRSIVRKKDHDTPALVSMEGGSLRVAFPGGSCSVPADGTWAGEVRVPTSLFVRLAVNLPTGIPSGDPLPVEVRDGRLYVGSAWRPCICQDAFHSEIELPLDADFMTLLLLPFRHTDDRLERAGLTPKVRKAQESAHHLCEKAAEVLDPLWISAAEIEELVRKRLERLAKT